MSTVVNTFIKTAVTLSPLLCKGAELCTSNLWNDSGASFALLFLNKLDMMNKVYKLPLVVRDVQGLPNSSSFRRYSGFFMHIMSAVMDYRPC